MLLSLGLDESGIGTMGSAGVPGCEGGGFWLLYSLCTSAWREARRLISRSPIMSPRLKFPLPCLNSHMVESGVPWAKTSLTVRRWSAAGSNATNPASRCGLPSIPL